jgi:hypothetical protein
MTSWTPDACTLPTEQRPLRVAEFDALFADALQGVERVMDGRVRLVLNGTVTFTFRPEGSNAVVMEVAAPVEHAAVIEAMARRAESARGLS